MNGSYHITGTQQNQFWYFNIQLSYSSFIYVYFQTTYSASLRDNFCIMLADVNVIVRIEQVVLWNSGLTAVWCYLTGSTTNKNYRLVTVLDFFVCWFGRN